MPKVIKEYNKLSKKKKEETQRLNDLNGSEWTSRSKSIVTYGGGIASKRKLHGASFPLELARHFIEIYSQAGDTILDPFMGVGTTADAASLLNRNVVGFELSKVFYNLSLEGVDPVDYKDKKVYEVTRTLYNESCMNMNARLKPNSIDLIVTSPPYADHLHKIASGFADYSYEKNIYKDESRKLTSPYSESDADFGNLDFLEYSKSISKLMKKLYALAKEGTYNVWVVRDYRDIQDHVPYVNLHGKIIDCGLKADWILVDIVIWNQSEQRKLVKLGGPKSRRFYFNIGHSFIVIFRKNIQGEKFENLH